METHRGWKEGVWNVYKLMVEIVNKHLDTVIFFASSISWSLPSNKIAECMIFAGLIWLIFFFSPGISFPSLSYWIEPGFEFFFSVIEHIIIMATCLVPVYSHIVTQKFIGHHANEDFIWKLCIHTRTHIHIHFRCRFGFLKAVFFLLLLFLFLPLLSLSLCHCYNAIWACALIRSFIRT